VPQHREERIGSLVVRASVETGPRGRLLVQLLAVNPHGPDEIVGIVDSSEAASRLVGGWLDSLIDTAAAGNGTTYRPADDER
jgi:hypothetical protein